MAIAAVGAEACSDAGAEPVQLASSKLLPAALEDDARAALQAREELASTGVGMNVAIPHVKLEGLEEAIFSLSVAPDGLERVAQMMHRAEAVLSRVVTPATHVSSAIAKELGAQICGTSDGSPRVAA